MNWRHTTEKPRDLQLVLVVYQDKIQCEVFVFSNDKCEVADPIGSIPWSDVQAWVGLGELPFPSWLKDQMQAVRDNDRRTVEAAAQYRAKNGDLFGKVVDPDDVDLPA